jgi:segregation and condensation protein A
MLGRLPDWASLESFLPGELGTAFERRSAVASTVAASLELTRAGRLQMRQGRPFGPIFVKAVGEA